MKIFDGQKGKRCDEKEYLTYTHKKCNQCDRTKAVGLFYKKKTQTARGWAWDTFCIECRRLQCRVYGSATKDTRNTRLRHWRKSNPVAASKIDRRRHVKRKYGITIEQVEEMRAAQKGACAICGRNTSKLLVDHSHINGRVRSLLCQTCNTFLGWYENKADTILRFQRYVELHTRK